MPVPLRGSLLTLWIVLWSATVHAQVLPGELMPVEEEEQEETSEAAPAEANRGPNDELVVRQQEISDKFRRLEEILLRMAELSAGVDPRRAALLRKAVAQSKDRLINVQFETLVSLLEKDQLSRAIENQGGIRADLKSLLELLLSEDRGRRIESEKARIREYLKRLNEIIKQQKGLQGRTAGGAETKRLADEQEKLAGKTGGLADDIKRNEEGGSEEQREEEDAAESDSKPSGQDKEEAGGKDGEKSEKEKSPSGDSKPEEKSPPEGGQPSSGEKSEGLSQPPGQGQSEKESGEPSQPSASEQENPARKRLEAARQRMREAEEKLKEAQREGAVDKQEEAIRELEQAKADLEEILRQLREEEIGRMLALLETRFRKMLQMQREVYEGTVRLDKVPRADRAHSHDIEAGRLSGQEADIVLEADKALMLMREDGSAVALPEAVEQMRDDMEQVVQRLSRSLVDPMTQGIEEDILAALEEMIEAVKKAQQELEEKQQQGPPPQGEPQDPPLVDILAELKMVLRLQMRVNRRTDRYSKLVEGEQATSDDVILR